MPKAKDVLLSGVEWGFLVVLWMLFVSQWKKDEFLIGIAVAFVGAVADAIVKAEGLAKFSPKAEWVLLILWTPYYVAQGVWATLKAFCAEFFGRSPQSRFIAKPYKPAKSQDATSSAKRALATAYLTIPPNSIVVGIDGEHEQVLMHEIVPEPTSRMAQKLGVQP